MNAVTLAPLDRANLDPVHALTPHADQVPFGGTGEGIASDPGAEVDFHGIYQADRLVGVFKIDRAYRDGQHFGPPGCWGLRGLLIDKSVQGQGIGTAAFAALPAYLKGHYPDLTRLWLTVNVKNPAARTLYLKTGWQEDRDLYHGGRYGPQHVLWLDLQSS